MSYEFLDYNIKIYIMSQPSYNQFILRRESEEKIINRGKMDGIE